MANYRIEMNSAARKELEKLTNSVIARIFPRFENLAIDPRPAGCKKLKGGDSEWRIRVGDYRVVYEIDDKSRLVTITRIRHHREVYDA